MKLSQTILSTLLMSQCAVTFAKGNADTIFYGGPILTVNAKNEEVQALAVQNGKIVAVGKAINNTSKAYEDLVPTAEKTVLSPAKKINSLGVAGDKEKLAIAYPEAPADVRELNNPDLVGAEDYIDVEIVEE